MKWEIFNNSLNIRAIYKIQKHLYITKFIDELLYIKKNVSLKIGVFAKTTPKLKIVIYFKYYSNWDVYINLNFWNRIIFGGVTEKIIFWQKSLKTFKIAKSNVFRWETIFFQYLPYYKSHLQNLKSFLHN